MELLLIALSVVLSLAGCHMLNDNGALTNNKNKCLIAGAFHITAIVLLGASYGWVRGFFIYLGLISFIGMIYSLVRFQKETSDT